MKRVLLIALAGALGALCRYGLAGVLQRENAAFPWGTLGVNVLGCLIAGALWAAFENRTHISPDLRAMAFVGFTGAFTTFSALIMETNQFLRAGDLLPAAANVALQLVLGMAALTVGLVLGRAF